MAIVPLGEFVCFGDDSEETRALIHDDSHYGASVPGFPQMFEGTSANELIVRCRALPIEITYRMERDPHGAPNAEALAGLLATSDVMRRAGAPPQVVPITSYLPHLASAVATALYPVDGDKMEFLAVTIAETAGTRWALYQTTRFAAADVAPIEWTNYRCALLYYQSWDDKRAPHTGPWPDSAFAEPSARMQLTSRAAAEAQRKIAELGPLDDDQAATLSDMLLGFTKGEDPPALPIHRATLELVALTIAGTNIEPAVRVLLRNLDEVKTTFDLRAWCWQCIWAIQNRRSS